MAKKLISSKNKNNLTKNWQIIGWQELVILPQLSIYNSDLDNLQNIKIIAKIDSGAKTSTINAINLKVTKNDDQLWAEFYVKSNMEEGNFMNNKHHQSKLILCKAKITEYRYITDSGGKKEYRPIINSKIVIGEIIIKSDISLTNRQHMKMQMLIGRDSLKKAKMIINPTKKFLTSKN